MKYSDFILKRKYWIFCIRIFWLNFLICLLGTWKTNSYFSATWLLAHDILKFYFSLFIFSFFIRNRVFVCLLFGQAIFAFSEFIFKRLRPKKNCWQRGRRFVKSGRLGRMIRYNYLDRKLRNTNINDILYPCSGSF